MNGKQKKTMMLLVNLTFVSAFLCVNAVESTRSQGRKLIFNPNKFIDLIMQGHHKPENRIIKEHHEADGELVRQFPEEITQATEISDISSSATARKVWSRWSKWGECSATCGQGTKTRQRLCLTGRCAPGEREEQRLPCCRQPCEVD